MAKRFGRASFGEYFGGDKIVFDIPMRDPSGVKEYSKNKYVLTNYNAVGGNPHPWSREGARYFDGTGDYIQFASGVDPIPAATDFSMFVNVAYDVWVPTGNRIYQQYVNNKCYIDFYRNAGWWVFGTWNGIGYDYTTGVTYSHEAQYEWNQLVITYNHASTTKKFYINGKYVGLTSAATANLATGYNYTNIGANSAGTAAYYHKGWLQDLGAVMRTVSLPEIQDYYKRSILIDRKPFYFHWPYVQTGWLAGWSYRKSITISRPSGAVTNYPMKILVGESSGATGEDVDCGGNVKTDFSDLRFTNEAGTTLDYWIESVSGTTPNQLATVWVEFDSIGTSPTTFWMFYGNAAASDAASGANTFSTFDDFERGVNGDPIAGSWTVVTGVDGTDVEISTTSPFGGTRCCIIRRIGVNTLIQIAQTAADGTYEVRVRLKTEAVAVGEQRYILCHRDGSYQTTMGIINTTEDIEYYTTGWNDSTYNAATGSWEEYVLNNINFTAQTYDLWFNGTKILNGVTMQTSATAPDVLRFVNAAGGAGASFYIDNFIVRNWRATEPAISGYGTEETEIAAGGSAVPVFKHHYASLRAS